MTARHSHDGSLTMERDADFAAYAAGRWTSLVRSAVLLGCAHADAEDLAQATLLKAWSSWPRVRRADDPDAYVYRILVNTLATSRRRRWWGERPTDRTPDRAVADASLDVELRDTVVRAVGTLPPDQRAVLVLRFVADLSERATAAALGIPVGTVKSRVSRALAAIDLTELAQEEL
ncbi:SigE family RNA polymerase sigma factor [Nocardioides sp. cx-169]|uniref:SigE family RNA polymerase sigma factor n=1 Tax=Nocardioides sp. cx-169 TaxID=2899080 RepID=UPI001E42B76E|nr:SigE family RNA polymerase sigma factor [Nocardioides sp. cx-169]MCD4534447.1 SigE family RNA polymerase sigma factor [Nocardioides sp. cx-169]